MDFSFESFVDGSFDYDKSSKKHTGLYLREQNADIGGGKIKADDIDILKQYPDIDTVTISGLNQETFEYFILNYGKQLKAIRFFKNKQIEDLSLLGTLPQLEYIYLFANQRVTKLWDMTGNTSLIGLAINDFSRLDSVVGIETAKNLKCFEIGNAIWDTAEIESFMPLSYTQIEKLSFSGKKIKDNDLSFLHYMPKLKEFNFSLNFLTTEQVAWIVANFPHLVGFALKSRYDCKLYKSENDLGEVPGTIIVGKRKPSLIIEGNEEKIKKYDLKFEALKEKYKGLKYTEAF